MLQNQNNLAIGTLWRWFKPALLYTYNTKAFLCLHDQRRSHHDNAPKKKSASSSRWLARDRNDFYSRKARVLNMKSRAGFKLQEINKKFQVIKNTKPQNIVDLGFAPGAWSQVAVSMAHPDSKILGVDILPCKPPKGASSMQANILSKRTHQLIYEHFTCNHEFVNSLKQRHGSNETRVTAPTCNDHDQASKHILDVVLSDMYEPLPQVTGFWSNTTNSAYNRMANTTGLKAKDHMMSMDLCDAGLILSLELLKPGGVYICKYFAGKEDVVLEFRLRRSFDHVTRFRPEALRSESSEGYFICSGRKVTASVANVFI